ncbi:MAG: M23 family metallopeptidase [Bdellovibrionaceae bacterium]|nr:M23 family metallopeptidase [Pseudobdellovibrionaceae bacterium]
MNARKSPVNGKIDCKLKRNAELEAIDFEIRNGKPWCKVRVLTTEASGSSIPSKKACPLGNEAYVASWLLESSEETANKYDPEGLPSDKECIPLLKSQLISIYGLTEKVENTSIDMDLPIKMRPCNAKINGDKDCNCRGVSSNFGMRSHPEHNRKAMHRGVDFGADRYTPIYAMADGIVLATANNGGYGKQIAIEHHDNIRKAVDQIEYVKKMPNGVVANQTIKVKACGLEKEIIVEKVKTTYSHLAKYAKNIQPGTIVKKGQLIGYVNSGGTSTGDHLHFEVEIDPYEGDGIPSGKIFNCGTLKSKGTCDPRLFLDLPKKTKEGTKTYNCSAK